MKGYQVDASLDVPIYQQLVDRIRSHILSGTLSPGDQLPTVRRLSEELGIAGGTIKRAYDQLEQDKLIEKSRGRGTFVSYRPESSDSRKIKAMAAIDDLLDQLEALGFSMAEMDIFLDLKLREKARSQSDLKVALVECNEEVLTQLTHRLREMEGLDIFTYLLTDILAYPYKLDDQDLIITTQTHAGALSDLGIDPEKIARIAIRPSVTCTSQIVKLQPADRVGILTASSRFGKLLAALAQRYTENVPVDQPALFSDDVESYLTDKTILLVPEHYQRCDEGQLKALPEASRLIPCGYRIDEGSYIYLEEKLERLKERHRLQKDLDI